MGTIVLIFIAILAIVVVPIMIAAKIVGAGNTGFGSCLTAAFLLTAINTITSGMVGDDLIGATINAVVGAVVFKFVLDTTFVRGLFISVLATVIVIVGMLALASMLIVGSI